MQNILPRSTLIILYKVFVHLHLDYRKLCSFYKIFKNESLRYLCNIIATKNPSHIPRNDTNIPLFKTNHKFLKNSFFPSTIIKWNDKDPNLGNSETYGTFKNTIFKFLRPSQNSVFKCHNSQGIKFLTRLRLGLSHLREHKFKHSFQDSLNPLCKYGFDVESISHFLFHCSVYNNGGSSFLSTIRNTDCKIPTYKLLENTDSSLTQTLLYGNSSLDINTNSLILMLLLTLFCPLKGLKK